MTDFSTVLAGFQGAAAQAKCDGSGRMRPTPGEYHLQLTECKGEAKTNQFGSFVQVNLKLTILDQGEFQNKDFTVVYLVNLDKDGALNFGGKNLIFLAGILAGEPIGNNDPVTSVNVIENACKTNEIVKARVFQTKKDYNGIDPMSLETPTAEPVTAS